MNHLMIAFVFFVLSVVIHIGYCRKGSCAGLQAKAFVLIALVNGAVMIICFLFLTPSDMDLPYTAALLYVLAIPLYLIFYVSTFLMSPSKNILRVVQDDRGATYEVVLQALERENFISLRLKELQDSGCAGRSGEKFVLTPSGRNIVRVLKIYQKVLGQTPRG